MLQHRGEGRFETTGSAVFLRPRVGLVPFTLDDGPAFLVILGEDSPECRRDDAPAYCALTETFISGQRLSIPLPAECFLPDRAEP